MMMKTQTLTSYDGQKLVGKSTKKLSGMVEIVLGFHLDIGFISLWYLWVFVKFIQVKQTLFYVWYELFVIRWLDARLLQNQIVK